MTVRIMATNRSSNLDLIPLSLNSTQLDCLLILLSRGQATTAKNVERTLQLAYLFEYANDVDAQARKALKSKYASAWNREEWMESYMEAKGLSEDKYLDKALEEFANGGIKEYGNYLITDEKKINPLSAPLRAEQIRLRIIKAVNDITNLKVPSHGKVSSALDDLRDKQPNGFKLVVQDKTTNEWHLADKFYIAWQDRRTDFLKEVGSTSKLHSAMLLDFYLAYMEDRKEYHSLYVKHIDELKQIIK